ncbi:hypothetical protein A3B35_00780 [Candidatus Kaiserbacteria bacterium RIFCSPLOWO2_01_FULL_54_24]|uniref:Blue (type 1) copper domain-containing protein n=1 Tax=Candidatus Kaiserbacteria bacterium RIFCSPLOWO2_01_FULL_54_24 TaxID=1798515 RepID=A0A1F6EU10_9BACT|nr:MAG: hypothetical protein A3B35_00780 [Candidatus Kaiserbacteria bacterium RIFCSPLOWO2_01_FULL_54_24]
MYMKNFIWALIVVVILGGGYMLWQNSASPAAQTETTQPTAEGTDTNGSTGVNVGVEVGVNTPTVITYSATGFSPSEVTIKKGGTVTWKNESGGDMWIATGPHPAHTGYSGTDLAAHCPDTGGVAFDQCASGATYSFTFGKVGTWPYHNHKASTKFGKVIVVE